MNQPGYTLRWTDAAGSSSERPLTGEVTIGRSSTSDVVLADNRVSRAHARVRLQGGGVVLEDLNSSNGTMVNGERVTMVELQPGDQIRIGSYSIELVGPPVDQSEARTQVGAPLAPQATRIAAASDGTIVYAPASAAPAVTQVLAPVDMPRPAPRQPGLVPDEILQQPVISEQDLVANGVEVRVADFGILGGGLGSFSVADILRISGVPANDIVIVGADGKPHARYERFVRNSQIPPHERLRSGSHSCPDNIWGFPGYAWREAMSELGRGHLVKTASLFWQIFAEPQFAPFFSPRTDVVFPAIDRECERIGWNQMWRFGRVRYLRKTREGRILAVCSASDATHRKHFAVSARFIHLAIGYPAIQLLPDLAQYRETYNDRERVVNAYEDHSHIYESLRQKGGVVLLRGRGIVASRIIQRLWEERAHNKGIQVVHLHRSRLTQGHKYGWARRQVENEFEFQGFNWPESNWTGENRQTLESATPERRKELLEIWGGTTTPKRPDWRRIIKEGLRDGWYRPEFGLVKDVHPTDDGRVATRIQNTLAGGGTLDLVADWVIDCTGLVASPDRSPLLADLIQTYQLERNPYGRVAVSNDFEILGMRHGESRMYASGAMTLGGPYATVDSFLGLQYAALRAVNDMHDYVPHKVKTLNGFYSVRQWFKWVAGAQP